MMLYKYRLLLILQIHFKIYMGPLGLKLANNISTVSYKSLQIASNLITNTYEKFVVLDLHVRFTTLIQDRCVVDIEHI